MEQGEIDAAVDLPEENPAVYENDENEDEDDYNSNLFKDMGKEVKSGY